MLTLSKNRSIKITTLILLLMPFCVKAQYSNQIVTTNSFPQYTYVGTLNNASDNAGSYQKIKVDIFGGRWTSTGIGSTTYYIANRGGLVVNQVTMGSSNDNGFTLQAYTNSSNTNIDFYVVTTDTYVSYGIKSVTIGGATPVNQLIPINTSSAAPSGTLLALTITPVLITGANGSIAINTTDSKGYTLAVNGSAIAASMTVKLQANWPDYVFKPAYQLKPLSEVKAYIDQNQHLPEMPSAAEVEKDGINLGEMNKLLLKKVEELTLYLIEKDKKEKELEIRIQKIEKIMSDQIK